MVAAKQEKLVIEIRVNIHMYEYVRMYSYICLSGRIVATIAAIHGSKVAKFSEELFTVLADGCRPSATSTSTSTTITITTGTAVALLLPYCCCPSSIASATSNIIIIIVIVAAVVADNLFLLALTNVCSE